MSLFMGSNEDWGLIEPPSPERLAQMLEQAAKLGRAARDYEELVLERSFKVQHNEQSLP